MTYWRDYYKDEIVFTNDNGTITIADNTITIYICDLAMLAHYPQIQYDKAENVNAWIKTLETYD